MQKRDSNKHTIPLLFQIMIRSKQRKSITGLIVECSLAYNRYLRGSWIYLNNYFILLQGVIYSICSSSRLTVISTDYYIRLVYHITISGKEATAGIMLANQR